MKERRRKTWGLAPLVLVLVLAGCGAETAPADPSPAPSPPIEDPEPQPPTGEPFAIVATNRGDIEIRLRPDLAPRTVDRFIELAEEGFYRRTLLHRIMKDTMIQGGDPNSKNSNPYDDGQGNSGKFLAAEFSKARFEKGTVAMARRPGDPNSASCQFFICLKRMSGWDGEYTVFGEVTVGIENAQKISRLRTSSDSNLSERPAANVRIESVTIEYREAND